LDFAEAGEVEFRFMGESIDSVLFFEDVGKLWVAVNEYIGIVKECCV